MTTQLNTLKIDNRTSCLSPIQQSLSGQSSSYSIGASSRASSYASPVPKGHRRAVSAFSSLADLKAQQRELSSTRARNVRIQVKNDVGSECVMTAIPESHLKQTSVMPVPTQADMRILGLCQPSATPPSPRRTPSPRRMRPADPLSLYQSQFPSPSKNQAYEKRDEEYKETSGEGLKNIFGAVPTGTVTDQRTQSSDGTGNDVRKPNPTNYIEEMSSISSELRLPDIILSPSSHLDTLDDMSELMNVSQHDDDNLVLGGKRQDEGKTKKRPVIARMKNSFKRTAKKPFKLAKKVLFRVGKKVKNALTKQKDKFFSKKQEVELERSMGYLL